MHTRWSIAIFLFCGLISAGMLLVPALGRGSSEKQLRIYRFSPLAAAVMAAMAVVTVALSLNAPANLINILGKPWAGLSSAVIAQIVAMVVAFIIFAKGVETQRRLKYLSAAVAVYTVVCLFRMYMISTRPALNSLVLFILLLLLALQFATLVDNVIIGGRSELATPGRGYPAVTGATGICLLVFTLRLASLPRPDRIFSLAQLTTGLYAPLFWAAVALVILIPVLHAAYSYKKKVFLPMALLGLYLVGLFVFCELVNQMPPLVSSRLVQ